MVDISGNTCGTQVGSALTPTSSDAQLDTMSEGPSQARPQAPLEPPQDPTQAGIQVITSQDKDTQPSSQEKQLSKWRQSNDNVLQSMSKSMKVKFDKYWENDGNLNYLLFVSVFLDPRYKLEYIEFCFQRMHGIDKCKEMVKKLKELIFKLFEHYMELHPIPIDSVDSSKPSSSATLQSEINNEDQAEEGWEDEFRLKVEKKQGEVKRNELERYMDDDVEDNFDGFEILNWWKVKRGKYHVLSYMVRDILAIPVSTVSSESTFSTGGRVIDPFRSSLHPFTVEALICTQNWLRNPSREIDIRVALDEVEKVESELLKIQNQLHMFSSILNWEMIF